MSHHDLLGSLHAKYFRMRRSQLTSTRLLRGVAHIENAIDTKISLSEIASIVALSEFHFHRQFRAHFGVSVMGYVRRRRLAVAAKALLASSAPILRLALEAGFQSQAAFTRAFRKVFHTTPGQFRRRGREVPWLLSVPISNEVVAMLPGLGSEQPRLEVIADIAVEGLTATIGISERQRIPQLWETLANAVGLERFEWAERIGLSEGDEEVLNGSFSYSATLSVDWAAGPDPSLDHRIIPGGTYLVFQLAGGLPCIPAAYDFIGGTWLPGSRHKVRHGSSFTRESSPAAGSSETVEIWIPVEGS